MSIRIYNSLTRKKEEFKPLKDKRVNIYTCGVTVYDDCHIGHARSLYIFDVIRRYLKYRRYKVKFIRNITDIDDKIINKAKELSRSAKEISQKYISSYQRDIKALGIDRADKEPLATEHIKDMIKHISGLIKKGYAYVVDGDVYFSVRKFKEYGKLSGQDLEQIMVGARVEKDERKKDPLDFALWKKSKEGEPQWKSPWSQGRPGWHIECSVMSMKYLGKTLDIHAGGRDLIFPHHENEIAQSEALTGKPFANYWIHHGLLTINGQKMAKSLGNFVTIKDFMDKYKNQNILKFFFLSAHYNHPIDYTDEKIEEAKKTNKRLFIMLKKVDDIFKYIKPKDRNDIEQEMRKSRKFEYMAMHFENAMDDDFNTPQALATIQKLITETNITIVWYEQLLNKRISLQQLYYSRYILLPEMAEILGLDLNIPSEIGEYLNEGIQDLIEKRNRARENKDFTLADKIRSELEKKGIILEDTQNGETTWRRKI